MKPERALVFYQGLVAGLLGYLVVALFFLLANLIAGRPPLLTAALLGQAFFYGLSDPSRLVIQPGPVLAFNGVHLLLFLALGSIAAWLAFISERGPHFWYPSAVIFLFITFHMLGFLLMLTEGVRNAVQPWTMVVAGVLACAAMAAYLVRVRPILRYELRHDPGE